MRKTSRLLRFAPFALFVAGALIVFNSATIFAQSSPTLTAEQEKQIVSNCVSIKSSLSQLHATDALLRVNRGQIYESMASKLMDRFNDRLGANDLDNKAMLTVTGNYRSQLNTFRTHYISYEQKLSAALATDCTSKPSQFYTTVQEARVLRNTVHSDVTKLHQIISDYRSSVGDFLLNYERVSE